MEKIQDLFYVSPVGSKIILGVTLVIFFILVVFFSIRFSRSIKEAAQNNGRSNKYLAAVPAEKIGTVNAVYLNTRKSLPGAMLLALLGGAFGLQRAYLGKRKSAMVLFLFFWTGIPTIISLFDLTDMPKTVSEYNLGVVESLYNQLAAPEIDR